MTKGEFVDFLIHGLTGGKLVSSQFRKYHPKVIALAVEHALNQIFYGLFKEDPSQLDLFAKTYDAVAITYNTVYRQIEATLPSPIVQIKGDNGIRWVISTDNPSEEFIRLSRDSAHNLHFLLANRVDDRPSYFLQAGKIVLSSFNLEKEMVSGTDTIATDLYYMVDGTGHITYNSKDYKNGDIIKGVVSVTTWDESDFTGYLWKVFVPSSLSMALIIPFSSLASTDSVMIPTGQNIPVLQFVKAYFNELGFQDLKNDSQSK